MRRGILFLLLVLWTAASFVAEYRVQGAGPSAAVSPVVGRQIQSLQPSQKLTVIITLRQQADLGAAVKMPVSPDRVRSAEILLREQAQFSQAALGAWLEQRRSSGLVGQVVPFWIMNGISVELDPNLLPELAARSDVLSITPDFDPSNPIIPVGQVEKTPTLLAGVEPNIQLTHAPQMWSAGFQGAGVVVAVLDTGVDVFHPDLQANWRGGTNSWFDPYNQHPTTPYDATGHGTQVTGVILGGSASGNSIGMAPAAQWIAAKIFNDSQTANTTAILQAFQWALDPDGNPATPDAPQVINNSWAYTNPGCITDLQAAINNVLAAGILPVFAAGNLGPNPGTSASPANYPGVMSVGAIDNSSGIYNLSSRGPNACNAAQPFPVVVAPGVTIFSSDLGGTYTTSSGTSLAAPHVSGALALLLNAYPHLPLTFQRTALIHGAVDLGPAGLDDEFGYGRLDVWASYQWLVANFTPPGYFIYLPAIFGPPHRVYLPAVMRG